MPSQISDRQYGQAVLDSVQSGTYPESEAIVAAELPPSALPTILKLVDQAREDVKKNIRQISKESASDIDGWISHAKQLRDNIEDTQKSARTILTQAQHGSTLKYQVNDAASKVDLLKEELAFNETLARTLGILGGLRQTLSLIEKAVQKDDFLTGERLLEEAENELGKILASQNPKVAGVFGAKIADLRYTIVDSLTDCWNNLVHVDSTDLTISIKDQIQRSNLVDFNTIVEVLSKLGLLEEKTSAFCKDLNTVILTPRLKSQVGATVYSLNVEDNAIRISGELADLSIEKLFSDMNSVIDFLCTRLPSSISTPLAALLMPSLTHRLISNWLSPEVPMDVKGIQRFRSVLDLVVQFAKALDSFNWPGKESLVRWADGIPEVWLNKRREVSLDKVRKLLVGGLGSAETVERVETQIVSHEDGAFAGNGGENEWNAEWSDEEGDRLGEHLQPSSARENEPEGEGEDEVSAWGLDEDLDEDPSKDKPERPDITDEGAEAWGWGDENDDGEAARSVEARNVAPKRTTANGLSEALQKNAREVTLKETYNITSLPKEILEIITHLISDGEILRKPEYIKSPIASAAGGLFSLPGLVLSMYRASAPAYYSMDPSGSMFLYNDSLWLAESLRLFTGTQFKHSGQINLGAAETEISALESFAKRTYGKEMESQRTIIGDLLDGAQGFANCTEAPFSQECDIAVSSVVDRLRDVYEQWKTVLSHSALLQSLGSLLSTVVNKIIVDVEDMSDISEPESQRLTTFCNRIAALEDLFVPQQAPTAMPGAEQTAIPLTAVYAPNWLKFQYLANILESSLVDIKYLWTEGELRLEFEAEELVDLIEALFADSEYRRKAIAEIRRASIRK